MSKVWLGRNRTKHCLALIYPLAGGSGRQNIVQVDIPETGGGDRTV
jgi:hypothetical protein